MRTFFLFFLYVVAGVTGQGFSTTFLQNTLFGGDHSDFGVASWSDQPRGVRYVVGQTYSSTFSGVPPLSGHKSVGAPDILLIKLDQATDSLVWYTVIGTARSDQPKAVTGDSEGNVWITGSTFGSFDDSEKSGASRGFLVKINSEGTTLLTLTFDDCQPATIESDSNGHIWIAGSATSSNSDSADDFVSEDVAIIVFSTTGEKLSSKTFGGSAVDAAKTIAVADNIVAVGGTTFSSDFPVTQGTRKCELCSGAGFLMTLTFDADNGIQQTYSSYIIGKEQQSLSVVDITFDANNNLYLAIYDDSNAMGAYIQQVKSDFTFGWVSENSDAFWKIEYLPIIDALYTIGSFSTPTDYATFYIMDTKSGAHLYSSKALTGALVDASVYSVDESTVKISMIGTLNKDLRISYHGRTYMTTHKSDDILIVSLTIRSLAASKKAQSHVVVNARAEKRANDVSWCMWNHNNGFIRGSDFVQNYDVAINGTAVILHYDKGHDYDLDLGSTFLYLISNVPAAGLGLPVGTWGTTFDLSFTIGFSDKPIELPRKKTGGVSHFEMTVDHAEGKTYDPIIKIVAYNQGRDAKSDNVTWSIDLLLPKENGGSGEKWTFTMKTRPAAVLRVLLTFDLCGGSSERPCVDQSLMAEQFHLYASVEGEVNTTQVLHKFKLSSSEWTNWKSKYNFIPKLFSSSTIETHLKRAAVCGLTETVKVLPVPLAPVLPVTGFTEFEKSPPKKTRADEPETWTGSWVGQTIIFSADSIEGVATKISFPLAPAEGVPEGYNLAGPWLFIYNTTYNEWPGHLKSRYAPGFHASVQSWGTGTFASWTFPSSVKFVKDYKYYAYIADALYIEDNLCTSDPNKLTTPGKRVENEQPMYIYDRATKKWKAQSYSAVYTVVSKPPKGADPFPLAPELIPPPPEAPPGSPPYSPPTEDANEAGDPFFVGFNGQKFEFSGTAGKIYNIYNDPWVNVNTLFGVANHKTEKGTVVHTVGVSVGQHNLFFDIANRENRRYFDVVINGVTTRVGHAVQHLSGCVDIQYNTKVILVSTPRHSVRLTIEWGHNWHIDVPYFDVHIHHPEEDVTKIGGLLGQTANEFSKADLDVKEDDFSIEDIFSFEKSKFYNLQSLDC